MRPIAKECLKAWTSSSALEAKHHGNINPYHDMIFLPPLFGKLVLQAAKRQNVACGTAALLLSKLHFKERCLSLISSNRNSLSEILIWHYKELWDSRSRLRASKVPAPASEIARAFVLADFPLPFTFKILLVSILVNISCEFFFAMVLVSIYLFSPSTSCTLGSWHQEGLPTILVPRARCVASALPWPTKRDQPYHWGLQQLTLGECLNQNWGINE